MTERQQTKLRYFIYKRKSTDENDRQVLSLESQRNEVKKRFSDLDMIELPEESISAAEPYKRPVFTDMLERIHRGEAQGIVAYHPDRLSRNSLDGAQIIYMLDKGVIKDLKFCSFNFDNSPDGKVWLSLAFSQSKHFSEKLGIDVKRGMRDKAALGWRPGRAPLGYLNYTPNIIGAQNMPILIEDPERFDRVSRVFKLMLTGLYSVPKLLDTMNGELALRIPETRKYPSRQMTLSGLYKMLTNPFYYGWFQWQGEWTEGKHEPMITAEEYDKIQYLLGRKGQPRQRVHKFAFTGMIRCGGCGAMVTAEEKFKTLKNGKILHFVYYHCTKKSLPKCMEKSIEVRKLHQQIDSMLAGLTISDRFQAWAVQHLHEIRKTEALTREESLAAKQRMFAKVTQDIDNLVIRFTGSSNAKEEILTTEEYQKLKGRLLKEKSILEEDLKQRGVELEDWVELSERTFDFARYARIWFERGDLDAKRAIFACLGSNPLIKDQRLILNLQKPLQLIFENKDLCEKEFDRLGPGESPEKLPVVEDFTKEFGLMSG